MTFQSESVQLFFMFLLSMQTMKFQVFAKFSRVVFYLFACSDTRSKNDEKWDRMQKACLGRKDTYTRTWFFVHNFSKSTLLMYLLYSMQLQGQKNKPIQFTEHNQTMPISQEIHQNVQPVCSHKFSLSTNRKNCEYLKLRNMATMSRKIRIDKRNAHERSNKDVKCNNLNDSGKKMYFFFIFCWRFNSNSENSSG